MIKHTIEISEEATRLSLRHRQLRFHRGDVELASVPCEDIGVVVSDHPGNTYTHGALTALAESGATVVLCGVNHLPAAMLMPLGDHSEIVWRLSDQLDVSKPLKKRLWAQLVRAKVRAQAMNLPSQSSEQQKLLSLAENVRSGDPTNIEAQAAKIYWHVWLDGEEFSRDPKKIGLNTMLNYGYSVLRAAVARGLVAAGLLPALGLHHRSRSNNFCLADDLMEPLRAIVDRRVRHLFRTGYLDLTSETKPFLLQILGERTRTGATIGPLAVAVGLMVASLVRCFRRETTRLEVPRPCKSTDTDVCGSS